MYELSSATSQDWKQNSWDQVRYSNPRCEGSNWQVIIGMMCIPHFPFSTGSSVGSIEFLVFHDFIQHTQPRAKL